VAFHLLPETLKPFRVARGVIAVNRCWNTFSGDQTDSPSPEITTNRDTTLAIGMSKSSKGDNDLRSPMEGFRGALIRALSLDGALFTLEPGVNAANLAVLD
jgi:hypothetical protein